MEKIKDQKENDFDFKPFATAIKLGRIRAGLTVEELAEQTGVTARYISAIENEGKHTSVKTLLEIIIFLHISIDEIIYPLAPNKDSQRRYIEAMLDQLDDTSMQITEGLLRTLIEVNKSK